MSDKLPAPQIIKLPTGKTRTLYRNYQGQFISKSKYEELQGRPGASSGGASVGDASGSMGVSPDADRRGGGGSSDDGGLPIGGSGGTSPTDDGAMGHLVEQIIEFELPLMVRRFLKSRTREGQSQRQANIPPTPQQPDGYAPPNGGSLPPEPKPGSRASKTISFDHPHDDLRLYDFTSWSLPGANLQEANLQGVSLEEAILEEANLRGARLQNARLNSAYLGRANLRDAKLQGADLSNAYLYEAILLSANLSGADLSRAKLQSANLSGANLSGAILRSANLTYADLSLADLECAQVDDGQLDRACTLVCATLPNGSKKLPAQDDLVRLRQMLVQCLSESDLRDLCFDLGEDYENLGGSSKRDRARELVAHLNRRQRICELVEICHRKHSDLPWQKIQDTGEAHAFQSARTSARQLTREGMAE